MLTLGIESSCDETAAAVIEDGVKVRSNVIASQIATHKKYGGVVPELASREHLEKISDVVKEALTTAGAAFHDIDGIAVPQGPGLDGSLLVGLNYAYFFFNDTATPEIDTLSIHGALPIWRRDRPPPGTPPAA